MASQTHFRTCTLCEAMCGIEIEYEGKEILSIKGDKLDPFSKGHICPKAVALKDIYEDKDRLRKPMKKTSDGWKEISWDKAFDEVVENIVGIQKDYGHSTVGLYQGNPAVHNTGTMLSAPDFVRALGTQNRYSATSVDQLPHHFASLLMFGHQHMIPIPDIDRTELLVIMGANPVISNGSLMTAPNIKKRLEKIRKSGGKIINIDPRFTETSSKSDQQIYIRPGSDVFMLLAVVNLLFKDSKIKPNRLSGFVDGVDRLQGAVKSYTPEAVEDITGIKANSIRLLVEQLTEAERAVWYGRLGVCTQEFGGLCMWLVNVINILTGNFDEPGGAMFTTPAIDVKPHTSKGHINRWQSRVRKLPEFGNELPVATLAEDILTPGDGQIRGMIINAGNPVLSTPNGSQLKKAFESLGFMVSIDIYLNETSSLANIILPPATGLEVDHYDLVFHSLAIRNTAKFSPALFKPSKEAKYDWQIFRELTKRYLKKTDGYSLKKCLEMTVKNNISIKKSIEIGIKRGPQVKNIDIKALFKNPHGIDLGPLESQLPEALYTANSMINIFPNEMEKDLKRVSDRLKKSSKEPQGFLLIGRRQLRTCNSWMHNSPRLMKSNTCTLFVHPEDAESVGLNGSKMATVKSRTGEVTLPYELTNEIMKGTLSIPHGWGHQGNIKLAVAQSNPGVSINDITDETFIDELTGNAALNGVPVQLIPA